MVDVRLLGPVEVWTPDGSAPGGEPRRLAVLAALAMDAGQVVSVGTLVDRVWGDTPPPQAVSTLRVYITRIRGALQPAAVNRAPITIASQAGGYRLSANRDRIDLLRFRDLVERARQVVDDQQRVELLRAALRLWRGDALGGVGGDWAARTRAQLTAERLTATVAWADAELGVGNVDAVLAPLLSLTNEYPLMEPLVEVYVRALVAAGRPTEALERCREHRHHLADQYGTEQGPRLQALYLGILRTDDNVVAVPVADVGPPGPPARPGPVPAQLPPAVAGFVGRRAELSRLSTLLGSAAAPVVALAGTAGVGKTTLAVQWAHQHAHLFPDGQLYANLRGFDDDEKLGPVDPEVVLEWFLDALGVPSTGMPVGLPARAALFRSLLAGRRMLILLDNVRDSAHITALLPGAAGCAVLVTSRNRLTSLVAREGARSLTVDLFTPAEADEFLQCRLPERYPDEPAAVADLITACDGLPLALSLAAAQAETRPGATLRALADELRTAKLQALSGDDTGSDLRAVLSWSYHALPTETAGLFRTLGLYPAREITVAAAASLAGVPLDRARRSLRALASASLLQELSPDRYTAHDLLRQYAAELANSDEPAAARHAAVTRLLDHCVHTAQAADQQAYGEWQPLDLPPPVPGTANLTFASSETALTWLTSERNTLVAAVQLALTSGGDRHAWQLAWSLWTFLDRHGHWADSMTVGVAAVEAACRLGDRSGQARALQVLGAAYTRHGRIPAANDALESAVDLCDPGDHQVQAHLLHNLSFLWEQQDPIRAVELARRGLTICRASGDRNGEARALNGVGWFEAHLGHYEQTLQHCQAALDILQDCGDPHAEAMTWDSIGYAHLHLGDHAAAVTCFEQALQLFRLASDRYFEAESLLHLGDAQLALGEHDQAKRTWQQCHSVLSELGHARASDLEAKLAELADASTAGPTPTEDGPAFRVELTT